MSKIDNFVDRFTSDGYSKAKWFNWTLFPDAFAIAVGHRNVLTADGTGGTQQFPLPVGQLVITPSVEYPGLVSGAVFDLTDSMVHVCVAQVLNAGNGSTSVDFGVVRATDSTNYRALFSIDGDTTLWFQETVGGAADRTSIPYDPVAHRFLRLRAAGGTLHWDTSPDSLNWTVQRSKAAGFDLTQVQSVVDAGYWDETEPDPGVAIFQNLNAYEIPAGQLGWQVGAHSTGAIDGGTLMYRNFFPDAAWLWDRIPDNPVLDEYSAEIIAEMTEPGYQLTDGAWSPPGAGCGTYNYAATLITKAQVPPGTPRYHITFDYEGTDYDAGDWGPSPFGDELMPIPDGVVIPPGTDGHLAVEDPVTGKVFSLWQARKNPDGSWSAGWGGIASSDGLEHVGGSTATSISRYAAVVRLAEVQAREIPHALVFGAGNTETMTFQYPAIKSDGFNFRGTPHPIREGQRIQLDPALDVESIPGITPAELMIARALQKYGAYCGDKTDTGFGWGFTFQFDPTATSELDPGQTYIDAGITWDYFKLDKIDWSQHLRVLKNWDGS